MWNGAVVAVKVVQAARLGLPPCGPDEQLEGYISANLRHPNIVTLYTAFSVERDAEPVPALLKRWGGRGREGRERGEGERGGGRGLRGC